jgi:hypothetical protein
MQGNIEVGLGENVPYLVDPWLKFPIFKDGGGFATGV